MVTAEKNKLIVLIVEDSESIQERLVMQLKDHENIRRILKANHFDEAVGLFREHNPQLIIMDIGLNEEKTGIDLLRFIKMQSPSTRVIMLSNRANKFYRELCLTLGCTHFVYKSKEFEKRPALIADIH
jgi:DNA-binding NarL/FixJ family response regulator